MLFHVTAKSRQPREIPDQTGREKITKKLIGKIMINHEMSCNRLDIMDLWWSRDLGEGAGCRDVNLLSFENSMNLGREVYQKTSEWKIDYLYLVKVFSLVQINAFQYCINPFPNKPWFPCVCTLSPLQTLWEKEKLLVTSNFSFSHSVFCTFVEHSAIFINFEIVVC